MIEIDLTLHRKARIWTNTLPQEACFKAVASLSKTLTSDTDTTKSVDSGLFAVEVFIPTGGRAIYGLLGAEYIHHVDSNFLIEVCMSETEGKFSKPLGLALENTFAGLPKTYAKSVMETAAQYFENSKYVTSKGKLIFKCAAYGEISSCQEIFEQLSTIICEHLASNVSLKTNQDYKDLILRNI